MSFLRTIIIIFVISSCGGGGGGGGSLPSVPFAITLGLTSFSLDEDSSFTGSIAATANEVVTFSYSIDSKASKRISHSFIYWTTNNI